MTPSDDHLTPTRVRARSDANGIENAVAVTVPPRTAAEVVASELRRRILDEQMQSGDTLPKLDDLVEEFGTSRPTIRDALRILETEGLATVRRGRFGGAIVHPPQVVHVARSLGLVLRTHDVDVDDLTVAVRELEPKCVELCARRPDRLDTVVPALRALQADAYDAIDDPRRFSIASTRFHEQILEGCGNATLKVVLGALEVLWTAHAAAWADGKGISEHEFPDGEYRRRSLDDHELMIRLIERGDAESAANVSRQHLGWTTAYVFD